MALSALFTTIATGTGTSNIASGSLGFTPKAVILLSGDSAAGELRLSLGAFTAALERACASFICEDGQNTVDTACVTRDDACHHLFSTSAATLGQLDGVSMDADTFTVIPDDGFPADRTVLALALGGDDLTNAFAGVFTLNGTTGNQDITTPGFQADCVIFFWSSVAVNTIAAGATFGVGVGVSSSERWAVGGGSQDNVADSASRAIVTTDLCIARVSTTADTVPITVDYVGGIAGGFRVNVTATGGATPPIGFLALKGPRFKAGTTAMVVGTTNQVVTGVGFTPKALLLGAHPPATANEGTTPAAHLEMMLGLATSSTARGSVWGSDESLLAASDTYNVQSVTRVAMDWDKETGATDEGDMDLVSFDADGFTLDQDTAAAQATLLPYLAIGDAASGSPYSLAVDNMALTLGMTAITLTAARQLAVGNMALTLGMTAVTLSYSGSAGAGGMRRVPKMGVIQRMIRGLR